MIGAGIGGLCLAHTLRRRGIDVVVHERDTDADIRAQGFRLGISEQGWCALLECLPTRLHATLDATSGRRTGVRLFLDDQLREVRRLPSIGESCVVDRQVLRHLLLTGLSDHVRFGSRFSSYETQADGSVVAYFADGGCEHADLLVGADGAGSAVRRQLLPDATITDTGVRFVLGRTRLDDDLAALVPGSGTFASGPTTSLLLGTMRFPCLPQDLTDSPAILPSAQDYLRWVVFLPESETTPSLDGWHPTLRAVVERALPDDRTVLSIRYADPIPPWRSGPVTVLGDAVHVMSPTGGDGANTALRDAVLLGRMVSAVQEGRVAVPGAMAIYERRMLDYGFAAVASSVRSLTALAPIG